MATDSAKTGCVVVGAGLSAANLVQELRELGYTAPITVIGDETDPPYERPPLSKDFLQGKADRDSMIVHGAEWADWYAEHDITTRFGELATAIDRDNRTVTLASGEQLGYRELVLATGSSPRRLDLPGVDLPGVQTLRRIADSDDLRSTFSDGAKVVLIGAGWIGLEVAAAAKLAGCTVTVLESAPLPLHRVLGDELAEYFADLHRRNGVDLRTGVTVEEITGAGAKVTGVRTDSGAVDADLVLLGVGAAPNTELAQDAGLEVDNGVLVDEHLRTEDPAVWAIGDVANATNTAVGQRVRVEHWDNAIRQGKLAAAVIAGGSGVFDWQPYFFTDQFDLGMEYVGYLDNAAAPDVSVVIRGDKASGEFIAFWRSGDTVRAAMNVNVWDVNDDLRALIGRDISAERLADVDTPLAAL